MDEDGKPFVGRGSFGIQMYRNIKVAVSVAIDVRNEANILAQFSHPFLPHLFGIIIKEFPYRIVMQYHGLPCLAFPFR